MSWKGFGGGAKHGRKMEKTDYFGGVLEGRSIWNGVGWENQKVVQCQLPANFFRAVSVQVLVSFTAPSANAREAAAHTKADDDGKRGNRGGGAGGGRAGDRAAGRGGGRTTGGAAGGRGGCEGGAGGREGSSGPLLEELTQQTDEQWTGVTKKSR